MPKQFYMGQEVLSLDYLPRHPYIPGKYYFWMKDGDGTIYLVKAKELSDGTYEPDFT